MIDVRCKYCNRILAKARVINAAIKCPSCKMIFEYQVFEELHTSSTYIKEIDLQAQNGSGIMQSEPQSS